MRMPKGKGSGKLFAETYNTRSRLSLLVYVLTKKSQRRDPLNTAFVRITRHQLKAS